MNYQVHATVKGAYKAFVDWTVDRKRSRKYFHSVAKAKTWADARNLEVKNSGVNAFMLSETLRVQAQEAALLLEPFGKTIIDAVRFAIPYWRESAASREVEKVIAELLESRKRDGRALMYLRDLKNRLAVFAEQFGQRKISEISASEIRDWLDHLPLGAVSRNNMRRVLGVMWSFAVDNEWCKDNPVKRVKLATVHGRQIGVLTVDQAAHLLAHAPRRIVPHLAIGLFCGLRRSELARLGPESVRWNSGLVEVAVTKTHGNARRFVRIRKNLRAWLLGCGAPTKLGSGEFQESFIAAQHNSGIDPWPNNALRHSFCSYALAHERNLNDLTLEMGHTNPHTLFAHYRELVTPEAAMDYWRLTPARAVALCDDRPMDAVSTDPQEERVLPC